MQRLRVILTCGAALLALVAQDASAQYTSNRTVMGRLDSMERNLMLIQRQMATGETGSAGGMMNEPGIGGEARIGELEETIRGLQGQIEESNHQTRQLREQIERLTKDVDYRLQALEKARSAMPSPAYAPDVPSTTGTLTEPAPAQGNLAGTEPPSEDMKFSSAREHYNYAFRLLNQANYDEAGRTFESFVEQYPKDALTGNAYYWLGETYYVQRDYVKAADNFRQGFEAMPSGPKAADNLLKLALSLNALERNGEACVVLKQIVVKFGKNSTSIKDKAQSEMARMRCS